MQRPAAVELNSVEYPLAPIESAYREYTEPALQRQPGIAGSSFENSSDPRPDIRTWRLDDWSMGEGPKVFDSGRPEHKRQYQTSSAPVTVATPGKLALGLALTESLAIPAGAIAASGPYLTVAGSNVWMAADSVVKWRATGADTWTNVATGAGTDTVRAPIQTFVNYIWVPYNTGFLRRINVSGNTAWTSAGVNAIGAKDGRIFFLNGSNPAALKHQQTSTAGTTGEQVGTIDGLTSANTSSLDFINTDLFFTIAGSGDEPRLFVYDGANLTERQKLPKGFRMDVAVPVADNLHVLNDVVFIGGWFEGDVDQASLLFVKDETSGVLGTLRPDTSIRITALAATGKNELLIGTRQAGNLIEVYRYDMATGGVSLFARKTGYAAERQVTSITRSNGMYFFGVGPQTYGASAVGSVERTLPLSTSGRYVTTTQVTHPLWDFDLPFEKKILYEVEIHTEPLPANTSVSFSYSADNGADVTVDRNSATMTFDTDNGTRTTFQLNEDFHYIQPKITLTTSDTSTTPVVLSVTMRVVTVNFIQFYRLALDLGDDTSSSRMVGQQLTGSAKMDNLRTLRDNKAAFTAKFLFPGPRMGQYPGPSASAKTVILRDIDIQETTQGEGVAFATLREL